MNNPFRHTKKPQTITLPDGLVTRKTIAVITGLHTSMVHKIVCKKSYGFPIMKMLIGRTETWDKQSVLNWMKTEHYQKLKKNAKYGTF